MSRNSTWYTISKWSSEDVIDRDLLFCRTVRTAKKARSIAASNPGAKILRERCTPSSFKWIHDIIPDNSKKMMELRRLYRKLRRREADEKRIGSKRTTRIYFGGGKRYWLDKKISDWGWFRHVIGVRKGTIL